MYFADASFSNNLSVYKGLLDYYLEHPNSDETRILFENIIKTAHYISTGKITETQIDHTIYHLITSMVDYGKTYNRKYFQDIDPNNIGKKQFQSLSNILTSLAAINPEFA